MEIEFFGEKVITIDQNQTILEAALREGIPHFHACGGKAKCSTCRVLVIEGEEHLSRPNKKESRLSLALGLSGAVRLACQARVQSGFVKLERMVKVESDLSAFLIQNGERPRQFKLRPLGEEKQLVLFFLDIRNFTPFVERYLPFDVIYLVRKLFDIFYMVLARHNGHILETAGDSVYAVFGYDSSMKVAADSAIAAGFEISSELKSLNRTYGNLFQHEFELGIGIHCGKVIVGEVNFGGTTRRTAMGRAVNIASRIQDSTKALNNSFAVSEEAIRLSSYNGPATISEVKLAGIRVPVKVYGIGEPFRAAKLFVKVASDLDGV